MHAGWMNVPTRATWTQIRKNADSRRRLAIGILVIAVCLVSSGWREASAAVVAQSVVGVHCTVKQMSGYGAGVRAGPSAACAAQGPRLSSGSEVLVDASNQDRTWVHIIEGTNGWIPAHSVTCDSPIGSLPAIDAPSCTPAAGPIVKMPVSSFSLEPESYVESQAGPPSTAQGGIVWVQEPDVDRPGYDYDHFPIDVPDPGLCVQRCMDDDRCAAFVYAEPGMQFPSAHCWLKDVAPPANPATGFIAGVKSYGEFETGIDRPGWDIIPPVELSPDRWNLCAQYCQNNNLCWAYTYDSNNALCWLKTVGPSMTPLAGVVSGVKVLGEWPQSGSSSRSDAGPLSQLIKVPPPAKAPPVEPAHTGAGAPPSQPQAVPAVTPQSVALVFALVAQLSQPQAMPAVTSQAVALVFALVAQLSQP